MNRKLWWIAALSVGVGCAQGSGIALESANHEGDGGESGLGNAGGAGGGSEQAGGAGAAASGGSSGSATEGGTPGSGGSPASGGSYSGGASATGGMRPSGGASVGGGTSTSGGASTTGGASPSGGTSFGGWPNLGGTTATGGSSGKAAAEALCAMVNAYRQQNGLPAVTLSKALFEVARLHVQDHIANPGVVTADCSARSWSDTLPWQKCCYTGDAASSQCMWDKPRQITDSWGTNKYSGNGMEQIDQFGGAATPEGAVASWSSNAGIADFILNRGSLWSPHSPWPAMGCWLEGGWASLWFGDQPDPQTYVP